MICDRDGRPVAVEVFPGNTGDPATVAAQDKAASKETSDGYVVHSFQTLLKDLATVTLNAVQVQIADALTFNKITQPTHRTHPATTTRSRSIRSEIITNLTRTQ